jgi:hypothetical protein
MLSTRADLAIVRIHVQLNDNPILSGGGIHAKFLTWPIFFPIWKS